MTLTDRSSRDNRRRRDVSRKPHERSGERLVVAPDDSVRAKARQIDETPAPVLPGVPRREHGAEPNRDGEGRNRAKNSRPFPLEYKKEDEGSGNEFYARSKTDQDSSIPRGDDKEVNDDQSNQHEVDLPEENVSRDGLESETGNCHNARGGQGHSKASSAHDHYKQIAADRHRREDPA